MKKYLIKVFILTIVFSGFTNCSKEFLETAPTDAISTKDALSTPENMLLAINGVHRTMYSQSPLDGYSYAGEGFIMPYIEFPGSDALHSTSGNGWFRSAIQWIAHTDKDRFDVEWVWYHYYHIIGNVNNIIIAAKDMPETPELKNVLAQALSLRAFAYFRLVNLFGKNYMIGNPTSDLGVPLMLATEAPYEGKPRATVEEIYTQIKKDIEEAITLFADASARIDNSNINLDAAQGIAARIYLFSGDWTKAAQYAHAARQNYSLMSESEYKSGFNDYEGTEVIWGYRIVPDQTTYYRAFFYYIGTNFNGTQNRTNPKFINHKLYAQIPNTDYRKDLWIEKAPNEVDGFSNDPNYTDETVFNNAFDSITSVYGMSSRFKTYPYMSAKFLNSVPGSIDPDDLIMIRASEMYLIEAEALQRGGDDAGAAQVLYELVSARDSAYTLSTNTGSALFDEIKIQRRIELWGEGHRFFDMIRWDEELDRNGTGADPVLYQKGFFQKRASENVNWVWQIPQKEIDANPNIIQNPRTDL